MRYLSGLVRFRYFLFNPSALQTVILEIFEKVSDTYIQHHIFFVGLWEQKATLHLRVSVIFSVAAEN